MAVCSKYICTSKNARLESKFLKTTFRKSRLKIVRRVLDLVFEVFKVDNCDSSQSDISQHSIFFTSYVFSLLCILDNPHGLYTIYTWSCHLNLGAYPSSFLALSMLNNVSFCPFVLLYFTPGKNWLTKSSFFVLITVSSAAIKY